ncbi:MAG TPA: Hsp20/alpha crystallin family protein [Candidatus Dormibacteraeota bacterium]
MTTRTLSNELVELDAPFAEFFRTLSGPWPFRPLLALTPGKHFMPTADVYEDDGVMFVRFDVPGVEPKDIQVKFQEGQLTVSGERKLDKEVKEGSYYRKESTYGFFERHVSLPQGIKESEIAATYDNGVLEIRIPRPTSTNGKPLAKTIPVKKIEKIVKPIDAKIVKPVKA